MNLWKLLRLYLTLAAAPDEPDPPTEPAEIEPTEPPADAGGDTLDDLIDLEPPAPARKEPEDDLPTLRARARLAEEALARERESRQAAPPPPVYPAADPEFEREEAVLRNARSEGRDETYLANLQWQIQSNRTLRESARASHAALRQAEDIADKTAFDRLEVTKPKLYARYADKVEGVVAQMKAQGQKLNAGTRMMILDAMVGRDVRDGKIKPVTARKPAAPESGTTVDRGRAPAGIRSDVRPKGNQTEREKRRARLENQLI